MVLAAVRKSTRELEMEVGFKADNVPVTLRKQRGGLIGVSGQVENSSCMIEYERAHPSVSIIDSRRQGLRRRYKRIMRLMKGEYNLRAKRPMCLQISRDREPTVDFKNLALMKRKVSGSETTKLGRMGHGVLQWHPRVNLEL